MFILVLKIAAYLMDSIYCPYHNHELHSKEVCTILFASIRENIAFKRNCKSVPKITKIPH